MTAQALQSTERANVVALAEWYANEGGDHWSACLTWSNLAFKCRGVEINDKMLYMRTCLSLLDGHVPNEQSGATKLKALIITRMFRSSPDKAESTALLERMISWTRNKEDPAPPRILMFAGCSLLNTYPSQYAINRTRQTVSMGGDLVISGAAAMAASIDALPPGFSKMSAMVAMRLNPHLINTHSNASLKWGETVELILGSAGEFLLQASELYSAKLHHQRFITQNQGDYILMVRLL